MNPLTVSASAFGNFVAFYIIAKFLGLIALSLMSRWPGPQAGLAAIYV